MNTPVLSLLIELAIHCLRQVIDATIQIIKCRFMRSQTSDIDMNQSEVTGISNLSFDESPDV